MLVQEEVDLVYLGADWCRWLHDCSLVQAGADFLQVVVAWCRLVLIYEASMRDKSVDTLP